MDESIDRPGLSPAEERRLQVYEAAIEAGFGSRLAQVLAVEQVRDEKLWRDGYSSFDQYCQERWQCSNHDMNRRIRGARVVQRIEQAAGHNVSPDPSIQAPAGTHCVPAPNLRQATELDRLPAPEQVAAWDETIAATNGKPTAKAVKAVVEQRQAAAQFPALAVLAGAERVQAARSLDAMAEPERAEAAALVARPGWPADRAVLALQTLAEMEPPVRAETLELLASPDGRDQTQAIARVTKQRRPADPRRLVLETCLPEVERCAKMYPADPLTPDLRRLAGDLRGTIDAIKRQEAERDHGTDAN